MVVTDSDPRSPEATDFDGWYRDAWPRVVRAVEAFTGDAALASDIAADACAKALGRWNARRMPEQPTAWTVAVALNMARKAQQRRNWQRSREPLLHTTREVEAASSDLDLRRAVARLPIRMRTAVALRYFADLPDREVASQMGISEGTVAATLHRARETLRESLKERPSES